MPGMGMGSDLSAFAANKLPGMGGRERVGNCAAAAVGAVDGMGSGFPMRAGSSQPGVAVMGERVGSSGVAGRSSSSGSGLLASNAPPVQPIKVRPRLRGWGLRA